MKTRGFCKVLGISVLSFGLGILCSFFLPEAALIVIETVLVIAVGGLYFLEK